VIQNIKKTINHELNQFAYNLQLMDPLGNPVVYQIELTNHCPMTCGMCPRTTKSLSE
jgi:MoaA/NifB/PqqE/SkfB family radical SAM enzyme